MEEVGRFTRDGDEVVRGIDQLVMHDLAAMRGNANKIPSLGVPLGGAVSGIGKCPRCGQDVVKSKSGKVYFCRSRKAKKNDSGEWELVSEGCGFKFSSAVCGKKMTDKQAASLLAGKTIKMSGLKSKAGKDFSAGVKINKESEWGTELVFDDKGERGKARTGAKRRTKA